MVALAGWFVAICSFVGLCAGIRTRFAVHRCIAPLVAASGIILILALAGMLNALTYVCDALYVLGIASLAYTWGIKRSRPSGALLLAMALYIAFLAWRFSGCVLRHIDDYSHWGTFARFMLMKDRLPVESDGVLSHQSYPPASACFIYFFCNLSGFRESGCLVAHNFLYGVALLPLFSLVQKRNRSWLYPIAGILTATFLFYPWHDVDLLVDCMEAFYGIGIATAILYYRNDPKRALICSIPAMAAVALFKNSGLFFSGISTLMLALVLRRKGAESARAWRWGLSGLLASVGAFSLWMLRVHRSFPSGNMGKHSISIASFSEKLQTKGIAGAWTVAKGMLRAMRNLGGWQMGTILVLLGALVVTLCIARNMPERMRRNVRDAILFGFGVYGVWLIMLFGMYLLSMSGRDAEEAASFARYNSSGYVYVTGLCCALLLFALQRKESSLPPALLRMGSAGSALVLACVFALVLIPGNQTPVDEFIARSQEGTYVHNCLTDAQDQYRLPFGERCLVFYLYDEEYYFRRYYYTHINILYQFGTGSCRLITAQRNAPDALQIDKQPAELSEVRESIAEFLTGGASAIILLDESPAFEAALEPILAAGDVDIPVCREYERFTYDGKRRPEAVD